MIGRSITLAYVVYLLAIQGIYAEDAAPDSSLADGQADEEHPATNIMKQVTIANSADVLDERSISVRDPKTKTKTTIRLGNVAMIQEDDDEKQQAKVEAAKEALSNFVAKTVFLWKAAPDEHQPKGEGEDFVLAEVWTADGRHVPSMMAKDGHLAAEPTYESEWATDILQAATGKEKRDAYAKLDEALKEHNADRAAAAEKAKEEAKEAEEPPEPIGFGGWIGLLVMAALVVGVLTNFGQGDKKKKSPNKKKSSMEKVWSKIKGQ